MSFGGSMSAEELTFVLRMRDEATAVIKRHQQELQGLGAAAGAANRPLGDTAAKLRGTGQAAKESASGITEWIGAASKAASAAVGFATSVGLMTKSVKDFAELEAGMIGVSKTTGIVGRDLRDLQDSLVSMSTVAPNTTKELTDIAEAAGQLGVSSREGIVAYTDTIAKMGAATNLHGEEAANILAKMQNLMGENTAQVKRLGSAMVALGNDSAASEREIAQMSMSVAQNTANFKIGSANAIGLSAAMVELGATAELGGSAMGRVFMQLDQAVKKGDQNLSLLAGITGKTREEFAALFKADPTEAVLSFVTAIGKLTKEGANTLPVFQQLNLDQLELMRVLNPLAANYEKITQRVRQSNQAFQENSALDKEAVTAYASLQNQLKMAGNAFTALSQSVGAVYAPAVEEAAKLTKELLTTLREGFDGLGPGMQAFIAFGAAATGVVVPLALAVRALAPLLSVARVAFAGIAALALGPELAVIASVIGLVAGAAAVLASNSHEAKGALDEYDDALKKASDTHKPAADGATQVGDAMADQARKTKEATDALVAQVRARTEARLADAQDAARQAGAMYAKQKATLESQAGRPVSQLDPKSDVVTELNEFAAAAAAADAKVEELSNALLVMDIKESVRKNGVQAAEALGDMATAGKTATVSMSSLDVALKEAADAVGLVYENGKLMLKSTSDGSAATEKLTAAFKSLDPAAAGAKERLALMDSVLQMIAEKANPAAAAIARLNSETAALKVPEGMQRDRWKFLFDAADPAQKQGMLGGKDLVDVFGFDQLNELNAAFTRNVQANSEARVATGERELTFDKRMAAARASGVRGAEAAARAQNAFDQEMLRSQNRDEAKRLASIELAKGMADAGAEAALAQREFRLAADAQQRIAEAATQGAAAIHEAELRNQAYAEAVKAGAEGSAGFNKVYAQTLAQLQRSDMAQHVTEFAKWTNEQNIAIDAAKRLADAQLIGAKAVQEATLANEVDQKIRTSTVKLTDDEIKLIKEKTAALAEQRAQEAHNAKVKSVKDDIADKKLELSVLGMEETQRSKILYLEKERRRILSEQGSLTEGRGKEQWDLAKQYAEANAELERGTRIWDTIKGAVDDVGQFLLDGLTSVENKGKSVFENMFDAARASAKRFLLNLAIDFAKQTIILPIAASFVGGLGIGGGGGVSPDVQSIANGYSNSGSGTLGNLASLGSKFMPSSWTSGITNAIDGWGYSSLGIGSIGGWAGSAPAAVTAATAAPISGAVTANAATGIAAAGNTAAANTLYSGSASGVSGAGVTGGLTSYLGPIGGGFMAGSLIGPMLANGNKAVGGLTGAASGAAAGALIGSIVPGVGTLVGALLGGASGGIGGLIGTQKPSVGKTASADVTIGTGGLASYGNILTDNEGDAAAGQALGQAVSAIFNAAKAGGGTLSKSFGFGQTEKDGYFIGGSVDYKKFGDNFADMMRYALIDQGGLQGGGANTLAAVKNSRNQDAAEFSKDVALGAAIDAGITALAEFDKSLTGVTNAAKKSADANYANAIAEKQRADGLGIGAAYADLVTRQIRESFDPVTLTPLKSSLATLDGQFAALSDAVHTMGLALSDAEIAAAKAAQTEKLLKSYRDEYDANLRSAQGLSVVDQAMDVRKRWVTSWQDDLAAGRSPNDLYAAQMKSLFDGITDLTVLNQATDALKVLEAEWGSVAANFAKARADEVRADQMVDLNQRLRAAQVELGQMTQEDYDRYQLEITQSRELKTVTDETVKAKLLEVQAAEKQALAAKQAAAATEKVTKATESLTEWLLGRLGTASTGVSATAAYQNSYADFQSTLALATANDNDALSRLSDVTDRMLKAYETLYGSQNSVATFQDIYKSIANLNGLSGNQQVIDAINRLPHAAGGPASGLTMVNDAGPELIRLPSGSTVMTHRASVDFLRRKGTASGSGESDAKPVVEALHRVVQAVVVSGDQQVRAITALEKRLAAVEAAQQAMTSEYRRSADAKSLPGRRSA